MQQHNAEVLMKKYLPYIIGLVVLVGGAGTYAIIQSQHGNKQSNDSANSNTDSSDTAATKKYTDACKLFTKADLGAALGGTYGDGEEEYVSSTATPGTPDYDDLKGSGCKFEQDNDGTTTGMTEALGLSVTINNYKDAASAKAFMSNLHDPQTAEGQDAMDKPVDVSGVGDQAFFAKVKTGTGTEDKTESMYVLVGRQVIVLTATRLAGVNHDAVQASLTTLAKKL